MTVWQPTIDCQSGWERGTSFRAETRSVRSAPAGTVQACRPSSQAAAGVVADPPHDLGEAEARADRALRVADPELVLSARLSDLDEPSFTPLTGDTCFGAERPSRFLIRWRLRLAPVEGKCTTAARRAARTGR
jgi:hypothetical protein